MHKRNSKILSLILTFILILQQSSFAQVAVELNIAGHLAGLRNSLISDKFRPIHLRYLYYDSLNNNFRLFLDKGEQLKQTNEPNKLNEQTKELLKYFYIGLALPNAKFWVNLRPDAEDNIIDDYLAKTDIGRIMLETDLQLKKDTAAMTSPQTPEGRAYWDKLYKKAADLYGYDNVTIPTLTRPWIVPGEIIIRETKDSAYIYKATLKVMLEQDYLASNESAIAHSTDYSFKDERAKSLNEYSTQLIRELIIPKLTQAVSSSKRYAGLRQVYYSLIMAQWFKARFKELSPQGTVSKLIDSQDLTNLISQEPWSKATFFQAYKKSFKDGEYNIQEPVYTPTGQVIRGYFSGGEVLTSLATSSPAIIENNPVGANIVSLSAFGEPQLNNDLIEVASSAAKEKDVNEQLRQVKVVALDLTGTLLTNGEEKAVQHIKTVFGIQDEGLIKKWLMTGTEARRLRVERLDDIEYWRYWQYVLESIKKEIKGKLSGEAGEFLAKNEIEQKTALRDWLYGAYEAIDGIEGMIGRLEQQGYKLVVVTNMEYQRAEYLKKRFQFLRRIEFITSGDVAGTKPTGAFYEKAYGIICNKFNITSTEQVLVVDDSFENFTYPRAHGWQILHVDGDRGPLHEYSEINFLCDTPISTDRNSEEIITGVHKVYERIAPKYAQTWGDEVQQEVVAHREKFLKEIPQGAVVVDLGTGPGRDAAWFKIQGLRAIGVDSSEAMLEQARTLYPDVDFRRMDLSNLQFDSDTVDALWDNATVHHLPPELAIEAVREFKRVLKPNGIIFLRVKRGNGEESQRDPSYPDELRYFKLYQRDELANLLISNGFEIVDSGTQPDSATSKQPARDIEWVYVFARKLASASSVNTTEGMGGIDFRILPIVTQAMTNLKLSSSAISMEKLQNINLNQELGDIQKMVEAGIIPSADRFKEYVASSCLEGDLDTQKVVYCIAKVLRIEEDRCVLTEPTLRDILVILESNRSMENLRAIFY